MFGAYRNQAAASLIDPRPAIPPENGELVITKRRVSAFTGSDLEVVLRSADVQHLVLCGIAQNYLHKRADASPLEKRRHLLWVYINCANILALASASTYLQAHPKRSSILLWTLTALTLFDFLYFGTLPRVVRAFGPRPAADSVPPVVISPGPAS